jgi:hypothetical protein
VLRRLLNDMGQFMGNQFPSGIASGIKTSGLENKLMTNGIGQGIHGPRGIRRLVIGVNANATEIMSEAGLEECASNSIERLARRAKHLMHDRRGHTATVWSDTCSLALHSSRGFFPAFFTLAPGRRAAARALTLQQRSAPGIQKWPLRSVQTRLRPAPGVSESRHRS